MHNSKNTLPLNAVLAVGANEGHMPNPNEELLSKITKMLKKHETSFTGIRRSHYDTYMSAVLGEDTDELYSAILYLRNLTNTVRINGLFELCEEYLKKNMKLGQGAVPIMPTRQPADDSRYP